MENDKCRAARDGNQGTSGVGFIPSIENEDRSFMFRNRRAHQGEEKSRKNQMVESSCCANGEGIIGDKKQLKDFHRSNNRVIDFSSCLNILGKKSCSQAGAAGGSQEFTPFNSGSNLLPNIGTTPLSKIPGHLLLDCPEEKGYKKRADRYDSSESSDSGVAALSPGTCESVDFSSPNSPATESSLDGLLSSNSIGFGSTSSQCTKGSRESSKSPSCGPNFKNFNGKSLGFDPNKVIDRLESDGVGEDGSEESGTSSVLKSNNASSITATNIYATSMSSTMTALASSIIDCNKKLLSSSPSNLPPPIGSSSTASASKFSVTNFLSFQVPKSHNNYISSGNSARVLEASSLPKLPSTHSSYNPITLGGGFSTYCGSGKGTESENCDRSGIFEVQPGSMCGKQGSGSNKSDIISSNFHTPVGKGGRGSAANKKAAKSRSDVSKGSRVSSPSTISAPNNYFTAALNFQRHVEQFQQQRQQQQKQQQQSLPQQPTSLLAPVFPSNQLQSNDISIPTSLQYTCNNNHITFDKIVERLENGASLSSSKTTVNSDASGLFEDLKETKCTELSHVGPNGELSSPKNVSVDFSEKALGSSVLSNKMIPDLMETDYQPFVKVPKLKGSVMSPSSSSYDNNSNNLNNNTTTSNDNNNTSNDGNASNHSARKNQNENESGEGSRQMPSSNLPKGSKGPKKKDSGKKVVSNGVEIDTVSRGLETMRQMSSACEKNSDRGIVSSDWLKSGIDCSRKESALSGNAKRKSMVSKEKERKCNNLSPTKSKYASLASDNVNRGDNGKKISGRGKSNDIAGKKSAKNQSIQNELSRQREDLKSVNMKNRKTGQTSGECGKIKSNKHKHNDNANLSADKKSSKTNGVKNFGDIKIREKVAQACSNCVSNPGLNSNKSGVNGKGKSSRIGGPSNTPGPGPSDIKKTEQLHNANGNNGSSGKKVNSVSSVNNNFNFVNNNGGNGSNGNLGSSSAKKSSKSDPKSQTDSSSKLGNGKVRTSGVGASIGVKVPKENKGLKKDGASACENDGHSPLVHFKRRDENVEPKSLSHALTVCSTSFESQRQGSQSSFSFQGGAVGVDGGNIPAMANVLRSSHSNQACEQGSTPHNFGDWNDTKSWTEPNRALTMKNRSLFNKEENVIEKCHIGTENRHMISSTATSSSTGKPHNSSRDFPSSSEMLHSFSANCSDSLEDEIPSKRKRLCIEDYDEEIWEVESTTSNKSSASSGIGSSVSSGSSGGSSSKADSSSNDSASIKKFKKEENIGQQCLKDIDAELADFIPISSASTCQSNLRLEVTSLSQSCSISENVASSSMFPDGSNEFVQKMDQSTTVTRLSGKKDSDSSAITNASSSSSPESTLTCSWVNCTCNIEISTNILEHIQTAHVATQVKSEGYVCLWEGCKVYNKKSSSLKWLERHVLSHGGHKPFKCIFPGCGLSFGSQGTLERHVNSHISTNCGSCGSSGTSSAPNKKPDCSPGKIPRRKKQKIQRPRINKEYVDFFDKRIMEIIKYKLSLAADPYTNDPNECSFTGQIIARRICLDREQEVLVRWHPINVFPDEWIYKSQFERVKLVPIRSIPKGKLPIRFPSLYPKPRVGKAARKFKRKRSSSPSSSSAASSSAPSSSLSLPSTPCYSLPSSTSSSGPSTSSSSGGSGLFRPFASSCNSGSEGKSDGAHNSSVGMEYQVKGCSPCCSCGKSKEELRDMSDLSEDGFDWTMRALAEEGMLDL